MKFAIIENGIVVNIAEANSPMADNWISAGSAKKGDSWDGTVFTSPVQSASAVYDRKETELIRAFDDAVLAALGKYTSLEVDSWYKQEKEARDWTANNSTPTPFLDAIAQARGATIAVLAAQIVTKANAFEVVYGGVLGKKQKLLDQLFVIDVNAPGAIDLINAINW